MIKMREINIWTDGACSGNPGIGGYAFMVIPESGLPLKVSGYSKETTTNNRMELYAIISALKNTINNPEWLANTKSLIIVHSDSSYCINPINQGWIFFWASNKWRTRDYKPVKNSDLWKQLYEILNEHKNKIMFVKIKGHSGDKHNEEVDKAAKEAIKRYKVKYNGK